MVANLRFRPSTHSSLTVAAVGLFLLAGIFGYDGLMRVVGGEGRFARVLSSVSVPPEGSVRPGSERSKPGTESSLPNWGYALELTVELDHAGTTPGNDEEPGTSESKLRRGTIRVEPRWSARNSVESMAAAYAPGMMVRVRRSASNPSRFELADMTAGSFAFLPVLLSFLGVICLAVSLRFSPGEIRTEEPDSPPSSSARPESSMTDLLQPRS